MAVDITIRVAGQAGQGMQSVSSVMGKVFMRQGFHVFIHQDVESRIRGGHGFTQLRVRDMPVGAPDDRIDLLIALDGGAVEGDFQDLADEGIMLYDPPAAGIPKESPQCFPLPMERLAEEEGKSKIMANTVATGAVFAILGADLQPLLELLTEEFGRKGEEVVGNNARSARAGYDYVTEHFKGRFPHTMPQSVPKQGRMLISGSEAMALGAIWAGLKFYSGYPMSPSTPIMEFIASAAKEHRILVEPAEDEISAINMIIGASFAGVRSMTATSGGGFCLMVEGLGLAGMTETPAVIVVAQRAGPSTGLPTRTEQSDLGFVIHASHGEFPRAVLAPGDAREAFHAMGRAFNLADRYQTPVIVLGDQHLNDSFFTLDRQDLNPAPLDRGKILRDSEIPSLKDYRRYAFDRSGISPRILPGLSEALIYADSDEHTETGHITESAEIRKRMMEKRMGKLAGLTREMAAPWVYPSEKADIVLLGWGSTLGLLKEAVDRVNRDGITANVLHFSEIFPFPDRKGVRDRCKDARIFSVENNFTGQFADYFSRETGLPVFKKILKYDGRPFTPGEIRSRIMDAL